MLYFIAIICPPLAVLFTSNIGTFILNVILTLCGGIPGQIHAVLVVMDYKAEKRAKLVARSGVPVRQTVVETVPEL